MQAATESKNEKGFRQRGAVDRDLFCPRLDAYLGGAAAAHGLRGTLASVTASIERGGVGGGGEDPNIGMLMRVGYLRSGPGIAQHRESERRFRLLTTRHQATALAHYLGTSRVHATLRANFGDLDGGGVAGVVLYRWQLKQAKTRQRDAEAGFGRLALEIDPLSSQLGAIEREMAESAFRRFELELTAKPLRAELARLLAQQAALAATGSTADDEQQLVDACRSKLTPDDRRKMVEAAEGEVRATHRDWYSNSKRAAKAWVEDGEPVA